MKATCRLEGIGPIKAALAELDTEIATKIGVKANRTAANILRAEIIDRAPFDEIRVNHEVYGHLRDNIKVRRQKARKQGVIAFLVTTGDAFWAPFLEFGTRFRVQTKTGKEVGAVKAQPFMRPALEAMRDQLRATQIAVLRRGIAQAAKKAAKAKK